MKNKIGNVTRILLLVAAVGLVFVLFTPIWRIELAAPQYPEGLSMQIHANGLKGNVDIINGLNHYIGMKTLHNEDFIEFTVLPYIIAFFAAAFLLTAIVGRRRLLNILFFTFVLFGILAMYDFWRWEYNYGHELNPAAAIVVPGMAYQPPLIGFKQLLNFGAYSIPDIGGWIFISAGVLCLIGIVIENKFFGRKKKIVAPVTAVMAALMLCTLSSCSVTPSPIVAGKDNCNFCKMTITQPGYAGEILTKKGKAFKFDDMHCMQAFYKAGTVKAEDIKDVFVADFGSPEKLLNVQEAKLLHSAEIHGPMNGNIIGCAKGAEAESLTEKFKATEVSWNDLIK